MAFDNIPFLAVGLSKIKEKAPTEGNLMRLLTGGGAGAILVFAIGSAVSISNRVAALEAKIQQIDELESRQKEILKMTRQNQQTVRSIYDHLTGAYNNELNKNADKDSILFSQPKPQFSKSSNQDG